LKNGGFGNDTSVWHSLKKRLGLLGRASPYPAALKSRERARKTYLLETWLGPHLATTERSYYADFLRYEEFRAVGPPHHLRDAPNAPFEALVRACAVPDDGSDNASAEHPASYIHSHSPGPCIGMLLPDPYVSTSCVSTSFLCHTLP